MLRGELLANAGWESLGTPPQFRHFYPPRRKTEFHGITFLQIIIGCEADFYSQFVGRRQIQPDAAGQGPSTRDLAR